MLNASVNLQFNLKDSTFKNFSLCLSNFFCLGKSVANIMAVSSLWLLLLISKKARKRPPLLCNFQYNNKTKFLSPGNNVNLFLLLFTNKSSYYLFFLSPTNIIDIELLKHPLVQVLSITAFLLVKLIQRHLQLLGISIRRYHAGKYIILKVI